MTQLFDDAGERVSVTVIKAGPCVIARRKTIAADGYDAVAVGFEPATKEKKITKPIAGLYKKAGVKPHKFLKEFRPQKYDGLDVGKDITVALFKKGDFVDVSGMTKGRGFQGVIKRCGKSGGPAAHGSKFHRTTGSVGMRTWPGRVLPGTGMAGQMGNVKRTIKRLKVVNIDADKNLLFVEGAVPGARNGLVVVSSKTL